MWTRGLRTRSSLSWMLAMRVASSCECVCGDGERDATDTYSPPRAGNLTRRREKSRRLLLLLFLGRFGRLDADLFEERLARVLLGDQFVHQLRQRHPPPADALFQAERDDRVRLRLAEVV